MGKMNLVFVRILICSLLLSSEIRAQEKLYTNEFSLGDVQLLKGPFQHARDLNIQTILKYHVDRLLAPYRREAGLITKDSSYPNWQGLDGHMAGHYLSALSMNYAATGQVECGKRIQYMIAELKVCQTANGVRHPEWAVGYVGGVPGSDSIWRNLHAGNLATYQSAWVPWYNLHKMYAGLRDAWLYAGNTEAKMIFLKFCDWGIQLQNH